MDVAFLIRGRETSGELDLSERRGPRTTGDNSSSGEGRRNVPRIERGDREDCCVVTRECNVT